MDKATRTHIRSLLWRLKETRKALHSFSVVLSDNSSSFYDERLIKQKQTWSVNQIAFYKMFDQTVAEVLENSADGVEDIFISKYLQGYPSKDNELVSFETNMSESTVKRRDNEFLNEIAKRLGWLCV